MESVTILAKLSLSPEEKEQARADMSQMLAYMDCLRKIDTGEAEPLYQLFPGGMELREDVVTNQDGSQAILSQAPGGVERGGLRVPRTIE